MAESLGETDGVVSVEKALVGIQRKPPGQFFAAQISGSPQQQGISLKPRTLRDDNNCGIYMLLLGHIKYESQRVTRSGITSLHNKSSKAQRHKSIGKDMPVLSRLAPPDRGTRRRGFKTEVRCFNCSLSPWSQEFARFFPTYLKYNLENQAIFQSFQE